MGCKVDLINFNSKLSKMKQESLSKLLIINYMLLRANARIDSKFAIVNQLKLSSYMNCRGHKLPDGTAINFWLSFKYAYPVKGPPSAMSYFVFVCSHDLDTQEFEEFLQKVRQTTYPGASAGNSLIFI